jgi:hypothetical protein
MFAQKFIILVVYEIHPSKERVFALEIRRDWVLVEHCAKFISHFGIWNKYWKIHVKVVVFALRDFVRKIWESRGNRGHKKPIMRPPYFCVIHKNYIEINNTIIQVLYTLEDLKPHLSVK